MVRKKDDNYPPLIDSFNLGDRVKRQYMDTNGNSKEYKGIILAVGQESIEVYWDTLDGKYRPEDMDFAFTTCPIDEIFNGNQKFTPIERE